MQINTTLTTIIILSILFIKPMDSLAQCISGDCKENTGMYIYSDKSIFIGNYYNGKANGFGTCYYSTGAKYVGEWYDHEYHGEGTYFFPDGSVENGTWEYGAIAKSVPWQDTTANRTPQTWAIIIGISNYPNLPPLNYTDDDAHRLSAFLQSPMGGSIEEKNIRMLIDEGASKANIIKLVHETSQKIGSNDQLIFFFSGHGFEDALAPIDFKGDFNKLFHKEVVNLINNNLAEKRLCILDACFAGGMSDEVKYKNSEQEKLKSEAYLKEFKVNQKTAFIFSSKAKESSIEQKGLRQGVFSHFLLKGLKGEADFDDNGIVTVEEISKYVKVAVKTYTNNYQTPIVVNPSNMTISNVNN
jgi:hypothetical protein